MLAGREALFLAKLLTLLLAASSYDSKAFPDAQLFDHLKVVVDVGDTTKQSTFAGNQGWKDNALAR